MQDSLTIHNSIQINRKQCLVLGPREQSRQAMKPERGEEGELNWERGNSGWLVVLHVQIVDITIGKLEMQLSSWDGITIRP